MSEKKLFDAEAHKKYIDEGNKRIMIRKRFDRRIHDGGAQRRLQHKFQNDPFSRDLDNLIQSRKISPNGAIPAVKAMMEQPRSSGVLSHQESKGVMTTKTKSKQHRTMNNRNEFHNPRPSYAYKTVRNRDQTKMLCNDFKEQEEFNETLESMDQSFDQE